MLVYTRLTGTQNIRGLRQWFLAVVRWWLLRRCPPPSSPWDLAVGIVILFDIASYRGSEERVGKRLMTFQVFLYLTVIY